MARLSARDLDAELDAPQRPESSFRIEQALNNPEFTAFLAQAEDGQELIETKDASEIERRYNAYLLVDLTTADIKELYQDQIRRDTGGEIQLDDRAFQGMEAHLRELVHRRPEAIAEFGRDVATYRDTQAKIDQGRQRVEQLGGSLIPMIRERSQLKERVAAAKKAKGNFVTRMFKRADTKRAKDAEFDAASRELQQVQERMRSVQAQRAELRTMEGSLDALQEKFFTDALWADEVKDQAQQRTMNLLAGYTARGDFSAYDKAATLTRRVQGGGETSRIQYLDTAHDPQQVLEHLDTIVAERMHDELVVTAETADLGSEPLNDLRASIATFTQAAERGAGGRGDAQAADRLVRETLEEVMDDTEDPAKRLVLGFLRLSVRPATAAPAAARPARATSASGRRGGRAAASRSQARPTRRRAARRTTA